jgi:hypothetical protein
MRSLRRNPRSFRAGRMSNGSYIMVLPLFPSAFSPSLSDDRQEFGIIHGLLEKGLRSCIESALLVSRTGASRDDDDGDYSWDETSANLCSSSLERFSSPAVFTRCSSPNLPIECPDSFVHSCLVEPRSQC